MDAQGNLYGTTLTGGATCPPYPGCGIIYELKPRGNGKWTYKVLHKFEGKDGNQPGGLTIDAAGNLYGGTFYGGRWPCSPGQGFGCGVVFELSPEANGKWDFKLLHSFDGRDGEMVWSYLSIDSLGRLYGTTAEGGDLKGCDAPYGCGVVFQLAPEANGKWREKVLHASHLPKHNNLEALAVDGSGNVYVTSAQGGTDDDGAVFELTATTHGDWNVTSLHSFNDKDGNDPNDLFFGSDGNLYGTTGAGGAYDSGTLFELTP